jgi:hypothetical protein
VGLQIVAGLGVGSQLGWDLEFEQGLSCGECCAYGRSRGIGAWLSGVGWVAIRLLLERGAKAVGQIDIGSIFVGVIITATSSVVRFGECCRGHD